MTISRSAFDHVAAVSKRVSLNYRNLDSLSAGDHHRSGAATGVRMDVGEWLRSLGLSRYEPAFRDAEIGPDVLPDLTDSDLEKLGVPLGDRKRLLKAIASFGPAQMVAEPRGPSPTPSSTDAAERRQLTVMFCDLVGSTALSARLDPEDMREVIAAYQKCVSETVRRFGGFVAKYMGDGVLAYFGYPQAHEHDAEQAVRAGLAVVEAVPTLQTAAGAPLHVRVGLATGIVVVGDLLGSGEAQERGVFGDTPHLAARLQVIAQPDSVVIAESTRKLWATFSRLSISARRNSRASREQRWHSGR